MSWSATKGGNAACSRTYKMKASNKALNVLVANNYIC